MYKVIYGNLDEVMPNDVVRTDWTISLGAKSISQITDRNNDGLITFFHVFDVDVWLSNMNDAPNTFDIESIKLINEIIEEHNFDIYIKENEGLMNANLNYLVEQGEIVFSDLKVEKTEQEELAYLYSKGCSGISKSRKYNLLKLE